MEHMVDTLNNVMYWTDKTGEKGRGGDPMELGGMECMARADYQPVYAGDKVFYRNVTGPKTLMIAWKRLVSAR